MLLETVRDQITVAVALVHTLTKLLFVPRAAFGDLNEDGRAERVTLANHLACVCHMLLMHGSLLLTSFLRLHPHLIFLIICALVTVLVLVGAWDFDQAFTLKVFEERDDAGVDVAGGLREDALLRLILILSFHLGGRGSLCSFLWIGLGWSLTLGALASSRLLFHILLADAFAALFEHFKLLFSQLRARFLLLEKRIALSAPGGLFGTARIGSFPTGLQSLLTVLLVSILDKSERLRVEHLDGPVNTFSLIVLRLALGPEMEEEDSLDHIVVLDFLAFLVTRAI